MGRPSSEKLGTRSDPRESDPCETLVAFAEDLIDPKVIETLSMIAGGKRLPAGWDR
jgi:hypothetical protein